MADQARDPGPILVTGAAGFIGSRVAAALLARGERVIGLDNFDPFYAEATKRANIAGLAAQTRSEDHHSGGATAFTLIEGDIRDAALVRRLYAEHGIGSTVHLAAKAGVRPSLADPEAYASVNVVGTQVLLDAAAAARAAGTHTGPFVLASSSSVYGNNEKAPFAEDDPVNAPISPYAATKRAAELIAHVTHAVSGMPIACLRFFTVFGPGQRPDLAIAKFLRLVAAGEPIPVFGDGSMERDFTYIDNVVAGVLAARERIDRHGYRIWNLGSDRPVRLSEVIETVGRVVGTEPIIDRKPVPPGDVRRTHADLTRSKAELGYEPETTVSFEEGVRRQFDVSNLSVPGASSSLA